MRVRRRWVAGLLVLVGLAGCGGRPIGDPAAPLEVVGLPAFPGARELDHAHLGPHWGYDESTGRLLETDAPWVAVRSFYERSIRENGWTVHRLVEREGFAHWHLYLGDSLGDVELTAREEGGVRIHLERHDKKTVTR